MPATPTRTPGSDPVVHDHATVATARTPGSDPESHGVPPLDWHAYFDDLVPGATFSTPRREVGERDVLGFAAMTGDHHPQHVDPQWAAGSPFGGRIAHGLLVLSYAAGLVPFDPERVVALRRLADCTFKRPLHLGEGMRVQGEVVATRPLDGPAGVVELRWSVRDDGDRLVCRARVEVLWARAQRDDPFAPGPDGFVPLPL